MICGASSMLPGPRQPLLPDKHALDHVRGRMLVEVMPDKSYLQTRAAVTSTSRTMSTCTGRSPSHFAPTIVFSAYSLLHVRPTIRSLWMCCVSRAIFAEEGFARSRSDQRGRILNVSRRVGLGKPAAPGRGHGMGQEKSVEREEGWRASER